MFDSGERNPLHRDATTVGHPPDSTPALDVAQSRVLEGVGAVGLDPHATQRAAAVVTSGHHHTRQGDGRTRSLGRRKDHRYHLVRN